MESRPYLHLRVCVCVCVCVQATVIFIFIFFAIYIFPFPLICFVILCRAFVRPDAHGIAGWLVRCCPILRSKQHDISNAEARTLARQLTNSDEAAAAGGEGQKAGESGTTVAAVQAALTSPTDPEMSPDLKKKESTAMWEVEAYDTMPKDAVPMPSDEAGLATLSAGAVPLSLSQRVAMQRELIRHAMRQKERMDKFGYLFKMLREKKPFFKLWTMFVVNLTYALATNLTSTPEIQLFVMVRNTSRCG